MRVLHAVRGTLLSLILGASVAMAETDPPAASPDQQLASAYATDTSTLGLSLLPDVVVVAAGRPQISAEVVGQVSIIEREEIERLQAQDLRDLIRYQPNVAVPGDLARFGADTFNIRGIQGNRISIEIDSVPLPDGFSVGRLSSAGRDLIDPELIKRVEILRGPASTLYGSDALGGVVAFTTRDPRDLASVDDAYAGITTTYTTPDDAMRTGLLGAWQGEQLGALALLSRRRGHETENDADDDEPDANPADTKRDSAFVKLTADRDFGQIALTLEHYYSEVQTDVQSVIGAPGQFALTQSLLTDDRDERQLALLSVALDNVSWLADELEVKLYLQQVRTDQDLVERRRARPPTAPAPVERARSFEFDTDQLGVKAIGWRDVNALGLQHSLLYGLEVSRTDYEELRDGTETNLNTGAVTTRILGEDLPVRDFPNSASDEWALFLTDELTLPDPRWALIGGLRYDHYRVDADADSIFLADNPSQNIVNPSDDSLSPKIGLRYAVSDTDQVYAAYVQGFRAPPFSDVNIALVLPQFNYVVLPNADLKPETSRGVELGWNHDAEHTWWRLAVFDNRYQDLIESRANIGVDGTGATIFQSVNRDRARIYGVEASIGAELDSLAAWLDGVHVHGAFGWAHGDDTARDQPLNTIQPARLVLGVGREARGGWPELGADVTAVAAQDRIDRTTADLFGPPGYMTLDLRARFRFDRYATLDVGVFNVFDQRYWDWSSLRGVTTTNVPSPGFYTEPGRNAAITLRLGW